MYNLLWFFLCCPIFQLVKIQRLQIKYDGNTKFIFSVWIAAGRVFQRPLDSSTGSWFQRLINDSSILTLKCVMKMKLQNLLCNSDFRTYAIWNNLPALTSLLLTSTIRAMTEGRKCVSAPLSRKSRSFIGVPNENIRLKANTILYAICKLIFINVIRVKRIFLMVIIKVVQPCLLVDLQEGFHITSMSSEWFFKLQLSRLWWMSLQI